MKTLLAIAVGLSFLSCDPSTFAFAAEPPSVRGVFVGSTPNGHTVRSVLKLPAETDSPIKWALTLRHNPQTNAPTEYTLRYEYHQVIPQEEKNKTPKWIAAERTGRWNEGKGTSTEPTAVVYELDGLLSIVKINDNIIQFLNPDRTLMIGDGGYSYTLNRSDAAEAVVDPSLAVPGPSASYKMIPLATGPNVFGIFEGRTPAQGIAREAKIPVQSYAGKAKWRITLFQDPVSQSATTYRIEGTFYRQAIREGKWSILRSDKTIPQTAIYQLEPANDQAAISLLKGDDNVLFFLDQNGKLLTGHADFSYTLNRRTSPAAIIPPEN